MMRQVPPAGVVIVIVVVVAIVAAISYFVVIKAPKAGTEPMSDAAKKKMERAQQEGWSKRGGPPGRGTGSGPPPGRGPGSGPTSGR